MTWSGIALAMHHRLSGIATCGLNGLEKGDEHPSTRIRSPVEQGNLPISEPLAVTTVYGTSV